MPTTNEAESRHLSDYWRVIRERRAIVITLFLIVLASGVLFTLLQKPVFEATAKVEIQVMAPQLLGKQFDEGTQPTRSPWMKESFFQTQFEKIRSRDLLRAVLAKYLKDLKPFAEAEKPEQRLAAMLKLEMIPSTDVAAIRARSDDPEISATVANAVAQTYVDWNLEQRFEALTRAHTKLQVKIQEERDRLGDRQSFELEEMARRESYTPEVLESVLRQQIEDVQKRMLENDSELKRARNALRQVEASGPYGTLSIPEIATDPNMGPLLDKRETLIQELATLLATRKEGHPAVQEKRQELEDATRALQERVGQLVANLQTERADLERALGEAKQLAVSEQRKVQNIQIAKIETDTQKAFLEKLADRFSEVAVLPPLLENQASMVETAIPPARAILPKKELNILVTLLLGILVSLGGAFFMDYWDTSVRKVEDVEKKLGQAVLCSIPIRKPKTEPLVREALQTLRTSLLFASKTGSTKSVVFTSSTPQEGKSSIVSDLGRTLAAGGDRTMLVDCDFRRPSLSHQFQVPRDRGVSSYLLAGDDYRAHTRKDVAPGLDLLTTGPLPPNPTDILASGRLWELFQKLEQDYDWVIVDAPPVASMSDAALLADRLKAVIFVIRYDAVDLRTAERALQTLQGLGARVLGVVLNAVDPRTPGYKDYFYGRYYYERGPEEGEGRPAKVRAASAGQS